MSKVLCIGLPRTGNQSLKSALQILGYQKVGHDPATIDELNDMDACVEVRHPISDLLKRFPDSSFIMTVRDLKEWVASVERIRPRALPTWNPFWKKTTHEQLQAYMSRLAESWTIPDSQLLIFDVHNGWKPLCAFLLKPKPRRYFPHVDQV